MLQVPVSPRNTLTDANVQRAALIVASLAFEGHIVLDPEDSESQQDYANAIRLTATILRDTDTCPGGDMPALPITY